MQNLSLAKKSVLVTGAASGIGLDMARLLIERGASVTMADLHDDALQDAAAAFPSERVLTAVADVTDAEAMADVVDRTVDRFGSLDVVVANAGIANDPPGTLDSLDLADYERVIDVDLYGVVRTVKPALPHIIESQGHVLITASIYSFANGVVNSAYALSKAAVESLGRSLRLELAPFGASAGTLHPGWVRTPLTGVVRGENATLTEFKQLVFKGPLGRVIEPEQVAEAAVRGIERRSAKTVVPRTFAPYSGLRGVMNAGLDAYLERDGKVLDIIRRVDQEAREHYVSQS